MGRTINGKEINQALLELRNISGNVSYSSSIKQLEAVIGCNYDVNFTNLQIIKVGSTDNVAITCIITLNDDAGNKVNEKSFVWSNEITYKDKDSANGQEIPVHLGNAISKAQKEAMKNCLMQFFSVCTDEQKAAEKSKRNEKKKTLENEVFIVELTSKFEPLKNYNQTYRASCLMQDEKEAQVICWYAISRDLKEKNKLQQVLNLYPSNTRLKIKAKKELYNGIIQLSIDEFIDL